MKTSFVAFTIAFILSGLILITDANAQVIAAPPSPEFRHHGPRAGYPNYPVYPGQYRPGYPGPGYPNYPVYPPLYPGPSLPIYPSLPYQTQFPFYFGSNVNPYWMPQNFYYQQQVYVCSSRGLNSGLYYTGWGVNPAIAQNYANYACAINEGNCVFFACIVR